jgi:hypothetical protein
VNVLGCNVALFNAGKTWNETMHDPDSHASLVAVRMLDEKEGWVSGGEMTNAFEGRFWHTLDGGDTWTKEVGCPTIADLMRMVLMVDFCDYEQNSPRNTGKGYGVRKTKRCSYHARC